jgi:hypothetical protein
MLRNFKDTANHHSREGRLDDMPVFDLVSEPLEGLDELSGVLSGEG